MAKKLRVTIIGLAEAEAKLNRLNFAAAARVQDVVKETALNVQRKAKRKAPVDTGRLRASIRANFYSGGLSAEVGTDVHYAPHLEYGTRKMSARPFLFPAWEDEKPAYLEKVRKALKNLED